MILGIIGTFLTRHGGSSSCLKVPDPVSQRKEETVLTQSTRFRLLLFGRVCSNGVTLETIQSSQLADEASPVRRDASHHCELVDELFEHRVCSAHTDFPLKASERGSCLKKR